MDRIAPPRALANYGIGTRYLIPSQIGSHHDARPFKDAALRHMQERRLYTEAPGTIDFLSETLFRTRIPVPANVARGQYNVEVYLFRDGEVVSAQSTPLFIDQTGLKDGCSTSPTMRPSSMAWPACSWRCCWAGFPACCSEGRCDLSSRPFPPPFTGEVARRRAAAA